MHIGTQIMVSSPAVASSKYQVVVRRDGVVLQSPYTFTLGDTATFDADTNADPTKVDFAIEINNGGRFTSGRCTGKVRIDQDSSPGQFTIPATVAPGTKVSLWAGFASSEQTVGITPNFDIIVTAAAPTLAPSLRPGASATPTTAKPTGPTIYPTGMQTLAPTSVDNHLLPTAVRVSSLPFSCALTPQLTLSWAVTGSNVVARLLLSGSSSNWFAAGVVAPGEKKMVTTLPTPNSVWLYKPDQQAAGLFSMYGQSAGKIKPVATLTKLSGVTAISRTQAPLQASMSLLLSSLPEAGVLPVTLGASDAHDTLIYAHSDAPWPAEHPTGAYGFSKVYWSTGVCSAVPSENQVSPYIIWVLLLPVIALNSPYSPLRTKFFYTLASKRVPLDFLGATDYSWFSVAFVLLYALFNLIVFFVGAATAGQALEWADITMTSGDAAIMNFWLAIIPTSRQSIVNALFGVPFERAVKFHKICVHVGMTWALVHLLANWTANSDVLYSSEVFGAAQVVPVYGFVAFILFCGMSLLAFEPIRRAQYDLFQLFHQLHWFGVFFLVLHTKSNGGAVALGFIPGILLQLADAFVKLRALAAPLRVVESGIVGAGSAGGEVTHLVLPLVGGARHDLHLGQFCYLNIKSISWFQWHPFSISAVERQAGMVHFDIKSMGAGTWTGRLAEMVRNQSPSLHVALHGPYGTLSLDLSRYRAVTLFAGGIGITPLIHILETVCASRSEAQFSEMQSIHLVWAVRDMSLVEAMSARLIRALNSSLQNGRQNVVFETKSPLQEQQQRLSSVEGVNIELGGAPLLTPAKRLDPAFVVPDASSGPLSISVGDSGDQQKKLPTFLRIEVYVTASKTIDVPESLVLHPSIGIHLGRPNVKSVINKSVDAYSSPTAVCALVCGPAPLSASVVNAAIQRGVDVHTEVFSL